MITKIVQVIENADSSGKRPDMGSNIKVKFARRVLDYETTVGKKWWKVIVEADSNADLLAWRNGAGNIGWLSENGPRPADATKIWNGLKSLIEADTPGGHTVWFIAPILPDRSGPAMSPTVLFDDVKLHIDRTRNKRLIGLWSADLAAGQVSAANSWLVSHPNRCWKGNLPTDGSFIVNEIASMAHEGLKFMGVEPND